MIILRKNIHMDCVKCKAVSQLTIEEDVNLPENSPDISKTILKEGDLSISDVKVSNDHALVKGSLNVSLLYLTEEDEATLAKLFSQLPFEESVYLEGAQPGDVVDVSWKIEDLSVEIINSRKISIRSVVTLMLRVDRLYDEEAAVDLEEDNGMEYRKKQMEIARMAICKRDIYRIRQETELPGTLPNIYHMIWQSVRIGEVDFKPLEDKIAINGEVNIFLLYEGQEEESKIQYYETVMPFSGMIECQGSNEMMIPDIKWQVSNKECEIHPDFDGEERVFSYEIVLDLCIKLYEEENIEFLSDVYGTKNEISTSNSNGKFKKLLIRNNGKCRVNDKIHVEGGNILQMIHSEGEVFTDEVTNVENGVSIEGTILVKCLYVTHNDQNPYASMEQAIPFSYLLEAKNIKPGDTSNVTVTLEQMSVTMLDANELEVKIILNIQGVVFEEFEQELISDLVIEPLDMEKQKRLPGIVIYVAKEGDSLWQIGKKYYLPVAKIKESNELISDDLKAGDKLLLVKEMINQL